MCAMESVNHMYIVVTRQKWIGDVLVALLVMYQESQMV